MTLYTLHSTLHTPHSTLHTPHTTHDTPHSTHYTLHSTLYTSHCTLFALHYTRHSPHSTLYTLTLHPHNFTLFTLNAPWNPSLALFSGCARTPTSRPQLRLCTALLLPALPKVHSDAEGGLLNLPQSLVIMLAMPSFFLYPLRATVHHYHMFSSSSPPTYIASISRFGSSPYQHAPASDPLAHVDEKVAQLRCAFYVFMPSSLSG